MFQDPTFEIIEQNGQGSDFKEEIRKLPYIFKDPIRFNKKVDPKKLTFGSKIDNSHPLKTETYYTVKRVISPTMLELNNGLKVTLIGLRENRPKNDDAIHFLKDKTHGVKVFMKFDATKYDPNNNLLCYLYLENKTFLNAHLIKAGLVDVETGFDYKYKSKFTQYAKDLNQDE